jgi:hypothetical protein
MRMSRVNITMPDELYQRARGAGLNISQLAQRAVASELERQAKIGELDEYLADLEAELGPISEAERASADEWADRVLGTKTGRRSA